MDEMMKSVLILSNAPNAQKAIERAFEARGFAPIGLNIDSRENEKLPDRSPAAILVKTDIFTEKTNKTIA